MRKQIYKKREIKSTRFLLNLQSLSHMAVNDWEGIVEVI